MTIRDVTRKVLFKLERPTPPTQDPWGSTRVGVLASTKINRTGLRAGLERRVTGGILVGDEVAINLDVEFVRA